MVSALFTVERGNRNHTFSHFLLTASLGAFPRRDESGQVHQKGKLVDERTGRRHGLEELRNDGKKLVAMLGVAPSNAADGARAVNDHVLRPTLGSL